MRPAPVALEAGTTDVTVTVSGEAILESRENADALIGRRYSLCGPIIRCGLHPLVELLRADVAQRERGVAQRRALAMRLLGDRRGLVVADVRVERGDQHQRALHQLGDARAVRLDAARRSARRSSPSPSASSRTLCSTLWMISGL